MKPSWLGFPLALSGLATSSVPVSAQSTKEEWTVSDARRTKSNSNTLCAWSFTVDPSSGKHADSSFQCSFNVTTSSGGDCGLVSFAEDSCSGNGSFAVDGGHSDFGFVVMVLVNPDQRSQAYFGFSDDALDTGSDIPKQTKSVIPQGTRRRRDGVAVRQRLDGDDIDDDITPSSTAWAVEDLFRDVDIEKHLVTIGFRILDGSPAGARCMLVLTPPEGVDMQTWEWYNRECEGSGYFASWGYMAVGDAGIMTIVNSTKNGQAFFGFSNINSTSYLGDAGPNPVSACNC